MEGKNFPSWFWAHQPIYFCSFCGFKGLHITHHISGGLFLTSVWPRHIDQNHRLRRKRSKFIIWSRFSQMTIKRIVLLPGTANRSAYNCVAGALLFTIYSCNCCWPLCLFFARVFLDSNFPHTKKIFLSMHCAMFVFRFFSSSFQRSIQKTV